MQHRLAKSFHRRKKIGFQILVAISDFKFVGVVSGKCDVPELADVHGHLQGMRSPIGEKALSANVQMQIAENELLLFLAYRSGFVTQLT